MEIVTNDQYIGNYRLGEWYSKTRDGYDLGSFSLGYFLREIGPFVEVLTIDLNGSLDTVSAFLKSDILEVRFDTEYTKMLDFYINQNKINHLYDPYNLLKRWKKLDDDSMSKVLLKCFQNEKLLSLATINGDYIDHGKIVLLTDNVMVLQDLDYLEGLCEEENPNMTLLINNIVEINFLSKNNYMYDQYIKYK